MGTSNSSKRVLWTTSAGSPIEHLEKKTQMRCPNCDHENPNDARLCGSCSLVFKSGDSVQLTTKARTSKLAILSLLLGILSLPFFLLAGIPAMVVAIVSIIRIANSGGRLKGLPMSLAGMIVSVVFMCIFCVLWCLDAPPIPNDYTMADLRSAPAEYAPSFEILKSLVDEGWSLPGSPAMGLTEEDLKVIDKVSRTIEDGTASQIAESLSQHTAHIQQAWARAEKARGVIRRLNEFPQIADLTEIDAGFRFMRWLNLITLARLHHIYAYSQTEQDDIRAVVVDVVELDSVLRKLSVNARPLTGKVICLWCMEVDTATANAIVNNAQTPKESIELLARHFMPVSQEQVSLRNGLLSEYLLLRYAVTTASDRIAGARIPLLKRNSMLRLYRNFFDDWIDAVEGRTNVARKRLSVWPDIYPFVQPSLSFRNQKRLPLLYRCYNPFARVVGFSYSASMGKTPTTAIKDDLLQIVLNRRLGKEVSLKARAYSEEYIVDVENRKIFSPGPDGKPGTKDDIKLPINPEVLGWGTGA